MLNNIEQIQQLLSDKKIILIALPTNADGDSLASALALKLALEKQHKQVDIVCEGFVVPKNLKFLPQIETIKDALSNLQKFIIKVDVSKNKIETLSYDIKDNWLSIYLTPKQGVITKNELRTATTSFKYDLIFALGAAELNSLGDVFYNNTDLFYRIPIINIDHRASNEHFGHINCVEITTTAIGEIIYHIIQAINPSALDEKIATALLTGMIVKTNSFKAPNVTPTTLNLASQLINVGGDREQIIQHLYRTKTLATLKLWGSALTHLQHDSHIGLVWTTLTREDFTRTGANKNDLDGIIEELLTNSPEAKMILVLYENGADKTDGDVYAVLNADKHHDAKALLAEFNPEGTKKQATIMTKNKTIKEWEEIIVNSIKTKITSN